MRSIDGWGGNYGAAIGAEGEFANRLAIGGGGATMWHPTSRLPNPPPAAPINKPPAIITPPAPAACQKVGEFGNGASH